MATPGTLHTRLVSAVAEAEAVLSSTAYSSSVAEAQDFAAAIYSDRMELLGQSRRASGTFIGTLGRGLRSVLAQIPPETLEPGDVLVTNDPWIGGGHLPDVLTVRPVFYGGEIAGYVGNVAHLSDLGGKPTPDGRDNFEEGFHLPPIHLMRRGKLNEDVMAFIEANSRLPRQVGGDVQAQSAANALMDRRMCELVDELGIERVREWGDLLQARSEEAMRRRLRALPDGEYFGEAFSDGVGEELRVAVRIVIAGDEIAVDFDGTSPQSRWGLNVPLNLTTAESIYSLRVALAPDLPLLEGAFRPYTVTAPEGCVLNPFRPAPTMVRTIVVHNVCGAIWRALEPLVPEHVPPHRLCAHFGGIWTFRFRGVLRSTPSAYRRGGLRHTSGPYTETYFSNGGMGALGDSDGHAATSMPVNCWNVPIEVMEGRAPVLFEEKRFRRDSGGTGRFRGGMGQQVRVRSLSDDPVDFIIGTIDRIDHAPFGLAGGGSGSTGSLTIEGEAVDRRRAHPLRCGEAVTAKLPGGGGFGPVAERARWMVERDLSLDYISEQAAREVYGLSASRLPVAGVEGDG